MQAVDSYFHFVEEDVIFSIWTFRTELKESARNRPGDQYCCVHGRNVVSSTWNVVGAQITWPTKLLILPVAKAVQRSFSVMADFQLLLKGTNVTR